MSRRRHDPLLAFEALGGHEAEDGRTVFSKEAEAPASASRSPRCPSPLERSRRAGARVRPVRRHRPAAQTCRCSTTGCPGRTDWIRDGVWNTCATTVPVRRGPGVAGALRRQPRPELRGATASPSTTSSPDGAGASAHLPVVHPRGRPGDAAVTGLTRTASSWSRTGGRRGREQLPLQREPGRPARPGHEVGTAVRSLDREYGEYLAGRCRPCGCPTQHELGQPGQLLDPF